MTAPPDAIRSHAEALTALGDFRRFVLAEFDLKSAGIPDWGHPELAGHWIGQEALEAIQALSHVSGPGHQVFVNPDGHTGRLIGHPVEGRPILTVRLPGAPSLGRRTAVEQLAQLAADITAVTALRIRLTELAAQDLAGRRHREAAWRTAEAAGLGDLAVDLELALIPYADAFLDRWRQLYAKHHPTPARPIFRPAAIRKDLR